MSLVNFDDPVIDEIEALIREDKYDEITEFVKKVARKLTKGEVRLLLGLLHFTLLAPRVQQLLREYSAE